MTKHVLTSKMISNARASLGVSLESVAEKVGVSRQCISFWELGQVLPRTRYVHSICAVLGLDLEKTCFAIRSDRAAAKNTRTNFDPEKLPEQLTATQLQQMFRKTYGKSPKYVDFRRMVESGEIPSEWNPFSAKRTFRHRRFNWHVVKAAMDRRRTDE